MGRGIHGKRNRLSLMAPSLTECPSRDTPVHDRLGTSAFWNRPLANPTQSIFTRFVRQPQAGLRDTLKDSRDKFDEFWNKALRTSLSEYLED